MGLNGAFAHHTLHNGAVSRLLFFVPTYSGPAWCVPALLILFVASFSATDSALSAGTFTLGLTPVSSQFVLVIGLTERAKGMRIKK